MNPPVAKPCRRFGQVIGIKPTEIERYSRYHADLWPEIAVVLRAAHVSNYSIFLKDEFLFAYFEYTGEDFAADMRAVAANRRVQDWWQIMEPMQVPLASRAAGEWWANMREVFHLD